MTDLPEAIVCEGCDAVCQRAPLREREVARCPRCGTELERQAGALQRHLLPLVLASLIVFVIANVFPIAEIETRGLRSQATLLESVAALTAEGDSVVALLVLATTILFPLLQLVILAWLLAPLSRQRRPVGFVWLVRALQLLRPWGMIEVFMLGVLVALVKLSSIVTILPGPALWAFMGLTVLLTFVLSFDPRSFWDMANRGAQAPATDDAPVPADRASSR